jgi:hypothetical membrane protein
LVIYIPEFPAHFAVQVAVAAAWARGYGWGGNTISDLGNTRCARYSGRPVCSPLHLAMDVSFVVLGVTMCAGALVPGRQIGAGRAASVGFGFLALAGAGTVVVGLFPENTIGALHQGGAALPFVLGNVGVVLLGVSLRALPVGARGFTVLAGGAGLVGLPLFVSHTYLGLGIGGMERVTAFPQDVWLIAAGVYLLTRAGAGAVAPRPAVGA